MISATIAMKETVWKGLVDLARRRRTKPEALAEKAVAEFLERAEGEELLAASERAAARTGLRPSQAESLVRKYRNRKA